MSKSALRKKVEKKIAQAVNNYMGTGLAQEENTAEGERYVTPGMPEAVRELAGEGIVLLKNENNTLPVRPGETVCVFGRVQHDWFYVGYGSGGDVHPPYCVDLFAGLTNAGIAFDPKLRALYDEWRERPENEAEHGYWGHWPYSHPEMPLTEEVVRDARTRGDMALVILGRAAGEDRENRLEEGSYYLTAAERDMLQKVTAAFDRVALLMDCGNIIDMSFTEDYPIGAVLYAWQLGQENGNAVADVLSGRVSPSGKLSDTIARSYEDYPSSANFGGKDFNNYAEDIYVGYRYFSTFAPERVLWPFGFGLSYTTFELTPTGVAEGEGTFLFSVKVKNTGPVPGKEVAQLYVSAPQGRLGKAKRSLAGFQKTRLLGPGEAETVHITVRESDFASYDDAGVTGNRDCFVLEAGEYRFYLGTDATADREVYSYALPETRVVERCHEVCSPERGSAFKALYPSGSYKISVSRSGPELPAAKIAVGTRDLKERILQNLPEEIPPTGDVGIRLSDVKAGKSTLDAFIAQLSDAELADLTRGEGAMGSALGTAGNAGAFGGITQSLRDMGIPPVITADGPAGLRIAKYTTLLPCGTAIACSWDPELVERVFSKIGQELRHFAIDVMLSPGVNIHRDPLCGRNFEYYSEDPMLSGRTAAAAVRGIQSAGASACPKHFACNNQEFNRNQNDSRVSVRALREIYLKNFEYCVKEGRPRNLMTSYNKINGVWSHYNYDLVTTVLRGEWGYEGNVITDWWMRRARSPEFPDLEDNAYRTRAQVDVLMPGGLSQTEREYKFDAAHLKTLGAPEGLTRAELQRSARNVLKAALLKME